MKRKILIILLSIVCALCFATGLTACDLFNVVNMHTHTMTHFFANAATCSEKGNIEYWYCFDCDKYFSDSEGDTEISLEDTIIEPTYNHTYGSDNLCTVCGAKVPSVGLAFTLSDDGTYYSVSGIGQCTDAELVIPEKYNGFTVKAIESDAFANCVSLTSVYVPKSIITIGSAAFGWCSSLKDITIPDSVTTIGASAFWLCTSLEKISIGSGVTSIGKYVFYNCTSLTGISVSSKNTSYKSVDENLYTYDGKTLVQYPIGKTSSSFTVPDGVTTIGTIAFSYCFSLTKITLPSSVTTINESAFNYCISLSVINLPDGVTTIGDSVFYSCSCLKSITIPDSVTSIGEGAFSGCRSLANIYVDSGNTSYKSIDGNLYSYDGTTLIQYAIGKTASSFTVPDSVISISQQALQDCELTSIVIGKNLSTINALAFWCCDALTGIYYKGTASEWNDIIFNGNFSDPASYGAIVYYYSEKQPTISGNYWHYVNGEAVAW